MWIGTRNPARASVVSGLQLCFKKTACLGAGHASRELPQVPHVQRGSPGTLGGARMAAVGTRCLLPGRPWGDAGALSPSGWEGTAWLCSCWQALWTWRRSTAWQPWDLDALCQGCGGDAEGTGTAPLCTSPGSRGGGGASPSCTGGHAVPGRNTGGLCPASTAAFPAGARVRPCCQPGLSSDLGLGERGRGPRSQR